MSTHNADRHAQKDKSIQVSQADLDINVHSNSVEASSNLFIFFSKNALKMRPIIEKNGSFNEKLDSSDGAVGIEHHMVTQVLEKLTSFVREHEMDIALLKDTLHSQVEVHHNEDGTKALEDDFLEANTSSPSNNSSRRFFCGIVEEQINPLLCQKLRIDLII